VQEHQEVQEIQELVVQSGSAVHQEVQVKYIRKFRKYRS
jgi:hypothetical protein